MIKKHLTEIIIIIALVLAIGGVVTWTAVKMSGSGNAELIASCVYSVEDFQRLATFVPTPVGLLTEVDEVTVTFRNKITTERAENFNSSVFRNYYTENDKVYFVMLTTGTAPPKTYDETNMAETGTKLYFDNRKPSNEEEEQDNGVMVFRMLNGRLALGDILSDDYAYIVEIDPNASYAINGEPCEPLEYLRYICNDLYQ